MEERNEEPLQAIVLTNSFTATFNPVDIPKCLCPLNNVALLDYTISFLSSNQVKEIIVFTSSHSDQIESHINSHYTNTSIDFKITIIKDSSCTNQGDALRELDKLQIVRSDPFLLVTADVVSNVTVAPYIEEHKQRHKVDSANMMTVLLKETTEKSENRRVTDELVVGIDTHTNQIVLFHDKSVPFHGMSAKVSLYPV